MTIQQIQDEIIDEFALFDSKEDKYNYIIELGKKLPPYPEKYRTEDYIVKGCQSKVWIKPEVRDSKIYFYGDSDSTLVKGIVSLLLRVLSGQLLQEVASADLYFIDRIGLRQMLSMNRSNGLASMIKQLKLYALAYQAAETLK
ncbi:MAG: SufE family protein [Cytophagales bacterium]|nr:SufE family protein [Bernardetiaceae bacterium]MDW8210662.1 SufE family protein [Cytophagales bacterium]